MKYQLVIELDNPFGRDMTREEAMEIANNVLESVQPFSDAVIISQEKQMQIWEQCGSIGQSERIVKKT